MQNGLFQAYKVIAELLSYPEELDLTSLSLSSREVVRLLGLHDRKVAELVRSFVDNLENISPEEYVDTFELSPKCPLYLGHYGSQEPQTCAEIGASERNQLMLEMANIYKHYGLAIDGKELPDFLPAVLEFLSLTGDAVEKGPRARLISEFVLPYLPPMRKRLEKSRSPYASLFQALERLFTYDLNLTKEVADRAKPVR